MEIYTESIKSYTCGPWFIRVWRDDKQLINDDDVRSVLDDHVQWAKLEREILLKDLILLDGVNAVEVKDDSGSGWVWYRDWP